MPGLLEPAPPKVAAHTQGNVEQEGPHWDGHSEGNEGVTWEKTAGEGEGGGGVRKRRGGEGRRLRVMCVVCVCVRACVCVCVTPCHYCTLQLGTNPISAAALQSGDRGAPVAAVRLGGPPLLEHSHAGLLEEAAPRSCDGDGSGRREVDTGV